MVLHAYQTSVTQLNQQRCEIPVQRNFVDSVFAQPPEGLDAAQQALLERFLVSLKQAQAAVSAGSPVDADVVRFEPAPGSLDPESESISATGSWRAMGTAPGDWLECTEPEHRGRWRLNWVTTAGTAVLKHFETRTTWILPLADFNPRIDITDKVIKALGDGPGK